MRVFGKLNLFLNVGEVQGGFHEIESVFAPCFDIYDEITVERCKEKFKVEFSVCDFVLEQQKSYVKRYQQMVLALPEIKDNTAKAVELFCDKFGVDGFAVHVKKGVPFLAGMGGSSADAVGVLKCLCEIFGKDYADVADIVNAVGSDLAGMWSGGVNFCYGRGENAVEIAKSIGGYAVVCAPSFGVSTGVVFSAFDSLENKEKFAGVEKCKNGTFGYFQNFSSLKNSLQRPAFIAFEGLESFYNTITQKSGCEFKMTGSGSGFFTLVQNKKHAEEILKKVREYCDFAMITRV